MKRYFCDVCGVDLPEWDETVPRKSSEAASAPRPGPKGKIAREKREILAAIDAYRRVHGPGSILKLAQLANVGESELRDMISCVPVPITTWRTVGKALCVNKSVEERGVTP